jgi:hypothetical protein
MTRPSVRFLAIAALTVAASIAACPAHGADGDKACALVMPAELEAALGEKAAMKPQGGTATASICSGTTPKASVMLRVAVKREGSADAAKAGAEMMRKKGIAVDVQTFGPITCSTMIPPENLAMYGYNTTCSVTKGTSVAAVEVTVKSKADMVPVDRLKPLAEKMAGRL